MSSGLRLLAAIALIAFLVVFGMLTALQELRTVNLVDPVAAARLGNLILPVQPIGGALPYKSQDYRDRFGMASAYYQAGEGESSELIMILSSMPPEKFREDGEWDQGLQKEWDSEGFRQIGGQTTQQFYFKGQAVLGRFKLFQVEDQTSRHQFVVPVRWGKQLVWVQVNGPSETVTAESVQSMLDSVEGEPGPFLETILEPEDPALVAPEPDKVQ
jgi:hypothetical protein